MDASSASAASLEVIKQLGSFSLTGDPADMAISPPGSPSASHAAGLYGLPLACASLPVLGGAYRAVYRAVNQVFIIVVARGGNAFASLNLVNAVVKLLVAECRSLDVTPDKIQRRYAEIYFAIDALLRGQVSDATKAREVAAAAVESLNEGARGRGAGGAAPSKSPADGRGGAVGASGQKPYTRRRLAAHADYASRLSFSLPGGEGFPSPVAGSPTAASSDRASPSGLAGGASAYIPPPPGGVPMGDDDDFFGLSQRSGAAAAVAGALAGGRISVGGSARPTGSSDGVGGVDFFSSGAYHAGHGSGSPTGGFWQQQDPGSPGLSFLSDAVTASQQQQQQQQASSSSGWATTFEDGGDMKPFNVAGTAASASAALSGFGDAAFFAGGSAADGGKAFGGSATAAAVGLGGVAIQAFGNAAPFAQQLGGGASISRLPSPGLRLREVWQAEVKGSEVVRASLVCSVSWVSPSLRASAYQLPLQLAVPARPRPELKAALASAQRLASAVLPAAQAHKAAATGAGASFVVDALGAYSVSSPLLRYRLPHGLVQPPLVARAGFMLVPHVSKGETLVVAAVHYAVTPEMGLHFDGLVVDVSLPSLLEAPSKVSPSDAQWSPGQGKLRWHLSSVYPGLTAACHALFRVSASVDACASALGRAGCKLLLFGSKGETLSSVGIRQATSMAEPPAPTPDMADWMAKVVVQPDIERME